MVNHTLVAIRCCPGETTARVMVDMEKQAGRSRTVLETLTCLARPSSEPVSKTDLTSKAY